MPTLILSARPSDDAQRLWGACISEKWQVTRAYGWKVPDLPPADVVVYGEPLLALHIAQTLRLHLDDPPVDWLPRLPLRWRGREVQMCTLAQARSHAATAFIKPADEKCFDARVYASGADLPAPGLLPEDTPVLIQEVVKWTLEFRCFVADRQVQTLSAYCRNGRTTKTEDGVWKNNDDELAEAHRFCETLLADPDVELPPATVIDVGLIHDRGWAVVEANCAWAAGTYGCDPVAILGVLRRACRPIPTG